MRIDVLNVGDGACAVVRNSITDEIVILDCGEWRTDGSAAARILASHLGARLRNVETLIITHFDDDHWRGLLHLADAATSPTRKLPLTIYYPRLPKVVDNIQPTVMALISVRDSHPVNVNHLESEWAARGRDVKRISVRQGDTFFAGSQMWSVHWPPKSLGKKSMVAVRKAIVATNDLADELAERGYPELKDQLREAYESHASNEDASSNDDRPSPCKDERDSEVFPGGLDVSVEGDDEDSLRDESPWMNSLPDELQTKFRDVARRIRFIDNALSLVVECSGFIGFGDIEGPALRVLAQSGQLRPGYEVMLAPHHGTHRRWNDKLPSAALCISQSGREHSRKNSEHAGAHTSSCCVSTHDLGTVMTSTCWPEPLNLI